MAVMDNARLLAQDLRSSEEYRDFERLKEQVDADETSRVLIKEYRKLQTALQMAAMAGKQMDNDEMQRFSQMSALLYASQPTAGYLVAEMRLQQLLAQVFQVITTAVGLELPM